MCLVFTGFDMNEQGKVLTDTYPISGLLRAKHPKLQISVVYEDMPETDFLSLFRLLDGKYLT